MYSTYALIYLVPATCFLLGIWMCLRVLAEFRVSVWGRRIAFTVLATLLLAPAVAGSIIVVVWVPNGLLLLGGDPPMLHQRRLVQFALHSFGATAVIATAISWVCIRRGAAPPEKGRPWRIGIPAAVIALLLGIYYASTPSKEIPDHIDWALLETEFGAEIDSIFATLRIADHDELLRERERLRAQFAANPIIWRVTFDDDRLEHHAPLFERAKSSSHSCSGREHSGHRLMRCSHDVDALFDQQTLKFERRTVDDDQDRTVTIYFDWDEFRGQFARPQEYVVDSDIERQQDALLIGNWRLSRRFTNNSGERVQTANLRIGPRLSSGSYAIVAASQITLVDEPADRSTCDAPTGPCVSSSSSEGLLKIRGAQVQIDYDKPDWSTDRLQIRNNEMVGRDSWGHILHFKRGEG